MLAFFYGIVCLDVVWRARHAWLEGEKSWQQADYKTAYTWYESAAQLFTPPESRWSRLARDKMPLALEHWKNELTSKGLVTEAERLP